MRYDVVLVPFPFDDLSGSKVRPAVCLTDPVGVHRHVVLAFVTSVIPASLEQSDVLLDPVDPEFSRAGLKVRSSVRLHRIVTVSSAIIQRRLGTLGPILASKAEQRLRVLFKL
jgi:mRNA interferase MazF